MQCIMHFLVTRNEYVTSSTYSFLHRSLLDAYDVEKTSRFFFFCSLCIAGVVAAVSRQYGCYKWSCSIRCGFSHDIVSNYA